MNDYGSIMAGGSTPIMPRMIAQMIIVPKHNNPAATSCQKSMLELSSSVLFCFMPCIIS